MVSLWPFGYNNPFRAEMKFGTVKGSLIKPDGDTDAPNPGSRARAKRASHDA